MFVIVCLLKCVFVSVLVFVFLFVFIYYIFSRSLNLNFIREELKDFKSPLPVHPTSLTPGKLPPAAAAHYTPQE